MNILLVSDFGIHHNIGGAQRSNQLIMEEGQKRNHNITTLHFDTDPSILNQHYDIVISSNLEMLYQQKNATDLLQYIVSAKKHVRLEHDANRYLGHEDRKMLFQSCDKTFFLTNFHYEKFIEMYGPIFKNVEIVPDPIDSKLFYNAGNEREDKTLYVGYMHYLKGTNTFIQYVLEHPDDNFVVAGWGDDNFQYSLRSLPNVEWLGMIDYSEMPNIYNKYARLYYHPKFFEPFCRSIGEAILCGIHIDANDLIGATYHHSSVGLDQFRIECGGAAETFWHKIESDLLK